MPKHLFEAHYTPEGVKGVAKEGGSGRRDAVAKAAESVGGKVESIYFAFRSAIGPRGTEPESRRARFQREARRRMLFWRTSGWDGAPLKGAVTVGVIIPCCPHLGDTASTPLSLPHWAGLIF